MEELEYVETLKAGFAVYKDTYDKWVVDKDIPEFMTNRDYISKFLV